MKKNEKNISNFNEGRKIKENKKVKANFIKTYIINYIESLIVIFILIIPNINCSRGNIYLRILNLDSEIIMTIIGAGEQLILNELFYESNKPFKIYVNNSLRENRVKVKDLTEYENEIKIKWNYQLSACNNMFTGLNNIIKIDFSNFDTSLVEDMSYMFTNCNSLTSLDLSHFNTSSVKSFAFMFYSCYRLKYLNLNNFNTSQVENMYVMFYNCSLLTSLDLSGFNTVSLKNIVGMFYDCASLKYLNIDNFNTSSIDNMYHILYNCSSLTSLDVSSFDTSLVENMQGMFGQCHSLISLNLSNFKTSKVTNMEGMFGGSSSLISLDLTNFDISSVNNMLGMFYELKSILYLNLDKFQEASDEINTMNMFKYINSTFLSCINSEINSKIYSAIQTDIINYNNYNNDCENICFSETAKINLIEKNCISDCKSTKYPFEYNKICYEKCPENTYLLSDNEFLCVKYCEKYDKFYNYNKTYCIDEIPEGFFLNDTIKNTIDKCHPYCKTCKIKYSDNNTNCDLCQNDKYYHWGNCSSNCIYGYYEDELGNKICNCIYNNKCKECSKESLELGLCISCNNEYYQKIDDISYENLYINCYKDPKGYYLEDNIYKPCYPSCKYCSGLGDKYNHKCIECNIDFIIKNNQNCYENCPFYHYYDSFNLYQCTEEYKCPIGHNKLIIEKNKCIEDCTKDDIYKIEFNNTCYKSCPKGTKISSNNNNLCKIECPEDKPYENENNECVQECNADNFFIGNCQINNNNQKTIDNMIKTIKEQLNSTLDDLIKNITDGDKKDLLIKAKEAAYQLTTTENQNNNKYNNISTIKLGECENILKDKYDIDRNKSLLIFKIDYYMPGLSIPVIGYEVYHPDSKLKLDLSHCKDSLIDFDIPVSIDESNLFKYDPNSEYYVDECYTYTTENGTDILLNDRKEEFVDNNLSLCENKCEYIGYEEVAKKASCKCEVKSKEFVISDVIEDKNLLSNNFTYDNSSLTMMSMKCILLFFL